MPMSSARLYSSGRRLLEQREHDLERLVVPAVLAAQRRQLLDEGHPDVPFVRRAHPAVADARRAPERGVGLTAAQDRHRGGGMRFDHQFGHLVVLAAPGHPAATPQRAQRRDHLVEPLAAVTEILAQQLVFLAHPADADRQRDPTPRHHRGRRHLLGHLQQRARGCHVHRVGEPQPARHGRHRTDQNPRVRPARVGGPPRTAARRRIRRLELARVDEVVGGDDPVEAGLVEHRCDRDGLRRLHERGARPKLHSTSSTGTRCRGRSRVIMVP